MASLPAEKIEKLTLAEFVRLQDTEGPFEIIEGERIAKMPTVMGHSSAANKIYQYILVYKLEHLNGEVYMETTFILPDQYNRDWVEGSRIPDVMFVSGERLEKYRQKEADWKLKPFMLVPDLVVEIVSPNDSYTELTQKVNLYLKDGVRLVWLIDPFQQTITIYTQGNNQITLLNAQDTLTGGDILPEFSISVAKIFE